MNESIRIDFELNGRPFPISALDANGLQFANESDAWPRSLLLEFDANNEITRTRMNWVRERMGWNPGFYDLRVTLDDGGLLVRGADDRALPGGGYWLWLQINGLVIKGGTQRISIDDDDHVTVTITVEQDPRRVNIRKPVDQWDDRQIRETVTRAGQTFDGLSVADWFASRSARECRKACLINLLAKLRTLPDPDSPFLNHVQQIFLIDVERIYARVDREMLRRLRSLSDDPRQPFYNEGPPVSKDHLRLLSRAGVPDDKLQSFRQDGRNSMQVVVAYPDGEPADGAYYADIDIDLGNPLRDLEGFVIHMGELLSGVETDHLKLHDSLVKANQPTAPFIYYDVRRA